MDDDKTTVLFNEISDMVANFLYYDRKEDEELPRGAIEDMISHRVVEIEDIINAFATELKKGLNQ